MAFKAETGQSGKKPGAGVFKTLKELFFCIVFDHLIIMMSSGQLLQWVIGVDGVRNKVGDPKKCRKMTLVWQP